jgi:hypothetical protein
LRVGGVTGGPPRSAQVRRTRWPSSQSQRTETRPLSVLSARIWSRWWQAHAAPWQWPGPGTG